MKSTQDIIGLPIISIFDGTEIGVVKSVVVNAAERAVSYLVVDGGLYALGAKVIPTDKILGIGEYAITVDSADVITMISKIPTAMELLEKNVVIRGSKVLTKKGRLAGEISEIIVDEDDCCRILGLKFRPNGDSDELRYMPDKCVITYGKHLVIVFEAFDAMLTPVDQPKEQEAKTPAYAPPSHGEARVYAPSASLSVDAADSADSADAADSANAADSADAADSANAADADAAAGAADSEDSADSAETVETADLNQPAETDETADPDAAAASAAETAVPVIADIADTDAAEAFTKKDEASATPAPTAPPTPAPAPTAAPTAAPAPAPARAQDADTIETETGLFEARQKQYLVGRIATKTILDSSGAVIIEAGQTITDDSIEGAKASGKMVQLVMNNRA